MCVFIYKYMYLYTYWGHMLVNIASLMRGPYHTQNF